MEHLINRKSTSFSHPRKNTQVFFPVTALHFIFLTAAVLIFVYFSVPEGKLFGSETDWYCQHVTLVDTMRRQFYATGDLFPDWISLGSGTNFYALSYYGFLRPDVLVSYLLPSVPVETVIQFYAVTEMAAGACLLYWWLFHKSLDRLYCLTGGFLYLTAGCMFQAHRQIMFVNYLPFLILALIYTDRLSEIHTGVYAKTFPLHPGPAVSFFMISVHSFYFLPSCLVCCSLYLLCTGKNRLHTWKIWLISVITGLCLAAVHLLPTALVILENKKDVQPTSLWQIFTVNPSMNTLLYSSYGCGLTLLVLYCVMLSLGCSKTKKLAFALLILCFSQLCCWLLNGTLYLRPKALIPFLPLFLLLTARTLSLLQQKKLKHRFLPAAFCAIPALVQIFFLHHPQRKLILADILVLLFYSLLPKSEIVLKKKFHFREKKQLFQNRSILFPFTGLSRKKPHSLRLSLYYTCSFICQHCQNRKIRCFLCKIQRNLYPSGTEGGLFRTRKRCRYFYCPHDKQQLRSFGKPTPYNHVFFCFQHRLQPSVL